MTKLHGFSPCWSPMTLLHGGPTRHKQGAPAAAGIVATGFRGEPDSLF